MLIISVGVSNRVIKVSNTSSESSSTEEATTDYVYAPNGNDSSNVAAEANNEYSSGGESDESHQVLPKPSEDEIQDVGRAYLHANPDEYTGKWVRIAGKIVNTESLQLDIEGPSTFKSIYCFMMSDQDTSIYKNDEYVTLVGKMDMKVIGQVMLNSCGYFLIHG